MPDPRWYVGWDLGGAHLKVALADGDGRLQRVDQLTTPLWQGLERLHEALGRAAHGMPLSEARHVVTMTGELADLFVSRRDGVAALVGAMTRWLPGGEVLFYAGPHGFIPAAEAAGEGRWIASANWYATARLVAGLVGDGLLLDVGSTTTDVVPLRDGRPAGRGYTDRERLALEELVYTGVSRTPLMSVCENAPVEGDWVGLAAEHFAQTADVYRLLGTLPEYADVDDTADGRSKTLQDTTGRLARTVGMDGHELAPEGWAELAGWFQERQLERIGRACARQLSVAAVPGAPLVGAGIGRFMVERLAARLRRPYTDIGVLLGGPSPGSGVDVADCAPAAAVAVLAAREREEVVPCPC